MPELFALYTVVAVPVGLAVFGHLYGAEKDKRWHTLDILIASVIFGAIWPITFMLLGGGGDAEQ